MDGDADHDLYRCGRIARWASNALRVRSLPERHTCTNQTRGRQPSAAVRTLARAPAAHRPRLPVDRIQPAAKEGAKHRRTEVVRIARHPRLDPVSPFFEGGLIGRQHRTGQDHCDRLVAGVLCGTGSKALGYVGEVLSCAGSHTRPVVSAGRRQERPPPENEGMTMKTCPKATRCGWLPSG